MIVVDVKIRTVRRKCNCTADNFVEKNEIKRNIKLFCNINKSFKINRCVELGAGAAGGKCLGYP